MRSPAIDGGDDNLLAIDGDIAGKGEPTAVDENARRIRQLGELVLDLVPFLSSVNRSSWHPWPTLARSEPTRTASAGGQLRTLNCPARGLVSMVRSSSG